jgi:hypothetical protein
MTDRVKTNIYIYIAMALFSLDCIKTHTYYKINSRNVSYFSLIRVLINYNPSPGPSKSPFWHSGEHLPGDHHKESVSVWICHMASKQLILRKNPFLPQTNT